MGDETLLIRAAKGRCLSRTKGLRRLVGCPVTGRDWVPDAWREPWRSKTLCEEENLAWYIEHIGTVAKGPFSVRTLVDVQRSKGQPWDSDR